MQKDPTRARRPGHRRTRAAVLGLVAAVLTAPSLHADEPSWISFTSVNRYASDTNTPDQVDDARVFTSEALFAASRSRLRRDLSEQELRGIARTRPQLDTRNTLRLRLSSRFSVLLLHRHIDIERSQITSFFAPGERNDVTIDELGGALAIEGGGEQASWLLWTSYREVSRTGLVEFLPQEEERVEQVELNLMLSRPVGDALELSVYPTVVRQDIRDDAGGAGSREREIGAVTVTVGRPGEQRAGRVDLRPPGALENVLARRFDRRGLRFFAGSVYDCESFGNTDVTRIDVFLGATIPAGPLDLTLEPTYFSSSVEGDPSLKSSQLRALLTLHGGPRGGVRIRVPVRYDFAVEGPAHFESLRGGLGLSIRVPPSSGAGVHLVLDLDAGYQQFVKIDEGVFVLGGGLTLAL